MVKTPDIEIDLDELNHSELVTLARWCGLEVSRAMPRIAIYDALYHFDPIVESDPIDRLRYRLSRWLKRYWDRIRMQAKKKACPNCFNCRDLQALECYTQNRRLIER
jgi:hypothetical protein